jgi:glucose-6-phosphate isomerase
MSTGPPGGAGPPARARSVTVQTRGTAVSEATAQALGKLAIWSPPRGGYLAIMAYLDRVGDGAAAKLRDALAARTTHPVTFGWGPRLLHSTGQYHKGGPRTGVFLQITGAVHVEVPGQPFTLGRLQLAQALGDLGALRQRGRPIARLHLHDRASGLAQLLAAASTSATGAYA